KFQRAHDQLIERFSKIKRPLLVEGWTALMEQIAGREFQALVGMVTSNQDATGVLVKAGADHLIDRNHIWHTPAGSSKTPYLKSLEEWSKEHSTKLGTSNIFFSDRLEDLKAAKERGWITVLVAGPQLTLKVGSYIKNALPFADYVIFDFNGPLY